jgi:thioredoxin 1
MKSIFFTGIALIIFTSVLFSQTVQQKKSTEIKPKITFIELGSVNCIPCKKMQPVMKAIEQKYGNAVKVIFYDVWTEEQKPYSKKYGIRLIPTQVFLDENGKEFFRHEGFYPEEEIHKIFKQRGIIPIQTGG